MSPVMPLSRARRLNGGFLTDTCVITHPGALSSDGAGGTVEAIGATQTVACALVVTNRQPREMVLGEEVTSDFGWDVHLPVGTDVRVGDRIASGGHALEVEGVRGPETVQVDLVAVCRELGQGP